MDLSDTSGQVRGLLVQLFIVYVDLCLPFVKLNQMVSAGMMHLMDHEKVNNDLSALMETEGLDIQLSYDGLRIPVRL